MFVPGGTDRCPEKRQKQPNDANQYELIGKRDGKNKKIGEKNQGYVLSFYHHSHVIPLFCYLMFFVCKVV